MFRMKIQFGENDYSAYKDCYSYNIENLILMFNVIDLCEIQYYTL